MNYLFYDLETTGTDQHFDQILQFAAVKTDSEFNPTGEPVNLLCQPRRDVVPSPTAYKTTCLDIKELQNKGITEHELSQKIHELFVGEKNLCIVGYNSKSFDDRRIQTLLYRNLFDPYKWSWDNGNSRLDIYDLVKLAYAFSDRVPGITWPIIEGKVSLKLEELTEANDLSHKSAHDALSDVYATINIAKLIREKNSKLFDHLLGLRDKQKVRNLIRPEKKFFHCSSFYGLENKYLSIQELIFNHPANKNALICWNLSVDPFPTLTASPKEVRHNLYSKKEERSYEVGFTEIKVNQCPLIVPYSSSIETTIDKSRCDDYSKMIKTNRQKLRSLLPQVYKRDMPTGDVDASLYAGNFFDDRKREQESIDLFMKDASNSEIKWHTDRFRELYARLRWRNYPDKLSIAEKGKYKQYLRKKYFTEDSGLGRSYDEYKMELGEITGNGQLSVNAG